MNQDPTILHNRLRQLAAYAKAARDAQRKYFAMPKVVDAKAKGDLLNASRKAEAELDHFLRMLDYEKLT